MAEKTGKMNESTIILEYDPIKLGWGEVTVKYFQDHPDKDQRTMTVILKPKHERKLTYASNFKHRPGEPTAANHKRHHENQ